jgi:hypothetical protein
MQLIMKIPAYLFNGEKVVLKVLIDTGAEANLVRKGLISGHLFGAAPKILRFITAGGQVLPGGDRTIELDLEFTQVVNGVELPQTREYRTMFYEAAIKVDAILSYPWLVEKKIAVFPHKRALAMDLPVLTLLYGLRNEKKKKAAFWK